MGKQLRLNIFINALVQALNERQRLILVFDIWYRMKQTYHIFECFENDLLRDAVPHLMDDPRLGIPHVIQQLGEEIFKVECGKWRLEHAPDGTIERLFAVVTWIIGFIDLDDVRGPFGDELILKFFSQIVCTYKLSDEMMYVTTVICVALIVHSYVHAVLFCVSNLQTLQCRKWTVFGLALCE